MSLRTGLIEGKGMVLCTIPTLWAVKDWVMPDCRGR